MTDTETAQYIREYYETFHSSFSWCTDACGYGQHIRFVEYRNKNWNGSTAEEFKVFALEYADKLEQGRLDDR